MIMLVVILHAGIVYEPILEYTWIVSDPDKSNAIGMIRLYLDTFIMFILFYISGYFIPKSAQSRNSWEFIKSKFNRIMIPWIVAVFTLIPAYKAIFLYSRGLPQEAWYTYFHLFSRAGGTEGYFADHPVQNWLWFLPVLFLFQIVYLGLSKINVFSFKISMKTAVTLTLVFGVVYSMIISQLELKGWYHSALLHFQRERLLVYFMVFLLGTLSYKLKIFESIKKNKRFYIFANVVFSVAMSIYTVVALNLFFNMVDPVREFYFISSFADRTIYYIAMLLTMFGFLYLFIDLFHTRFNKYNRLLHELNNNSYSVYIIHVVVLGIIALPLLHSSMPAFVKFILLAILTFIVSNVLVSIYKKMAQNLAPNKYVRMAIPIVAILLSIVVYAKQHEFVRPDLQSTNMEEQVAAPQTSLHLAVIEGNKEAVIQHIKAGSDLDIREPSGGSSPLISAALFGKTEIALALIEAGADVNFKNKEGSTPLHTAAFFCRIKIVESLLMNGADKNIRNNNGSTALESVSAPFEAVEGIYNYFRNTLGPLGLELDYDHIKKTRPVIAEILKLQ